PEGIRAVQSIVVAELTAESAKQGRTRRRSSVLQIDGRFHTASTQGGLSDCSKVDAHAESWVCPLAISIGCRTG
ncbi:hypothetical protein, partial [Ralstonia pseudosolanacearum]|uniref:hypothetical protein n=1 Tax=Ralstonia pseudosolanacearum TaxID=1310165 RepID=UPI0020033BC7